MHGCKNHRVAINNLLEDFVLLVLTILVSVSFGGTRRVQSSYKLWLPSGNLGLLVPRDQQEKTEVTVLAGVINTDQQSGARLLAQWRLGGMNVETWWSIWILALSCPHCKYEQSNEPTWTVKVMMIKSSDISGMQIWFLPPSKPPRSAEGITEDEGNVEWRVEQGEDEYVL